MSKKVKVRVNKADIFAEIEKKFPGLYLKYIPKDGAPDFITLEGELVEENNWDKINELIEYLRRKGE